MAIQKYLKLAAQVVATVLGALIPYLTTSGFSNLTPSEWVNVAIIGVGAMVVFQAPNIPGAVYTKLICSAATAALTVLASAIVGGIDAGEWVQIALAILGALGVAGLKNVDERGRNISYLPGVPNRDPDTGRFIRRRTA